MSQTPGPVPRLVPLRHLTYQGLRLPGKSPGVTTERQDRVFTRGNETDLNYTSRRRGDEGDSSGAPLLPEHGYLFDRRPKLREGGKEVPSGWSRPSVHPLSHEGGVSQGRGDTGRVPRLVWTTVVGTSLSRGRDGSGARSDSGRTTKTLRDHDRPPDRDSFTSRLPLLSCPLVVYV